MDPIRHKRAHCAGSQTALAHLHWGLVWVHIPYFHIKYYPKKREKQKLGPSEQEIQGLSTQGGKPRIHLCLLLFFPELRKSELREKCTSVSQLQSCLNAFQIAGLCNTFRNGMTKGRSGKFVASCSLEWNSSMVKVEFYREGEKERGRREEANAWVHVENIMW